MNLYLRRARWGVLWNAVAFDTDHGFAAGCTVGEDFVVTASIGVEAAVSRTGVCIVTVHQLAFAT